MQLQFEVTAALLAAIAFLVWLLRLEGQVIKLKEDNIRLEKELDETRGLHHEKDRVIWDKIDSLQTMVQDVLKSLGRLEGKMEAKTK